MSRTFVVLVLAILSGCAVMQRSYEPPTSGDVAYLRVVRSAVKPAYSSQIGIATFKQAETCRERYWLQRPAQFADVTTAFARVPAGAPMSVAIHESLGGSLATTIKFCVPVLMFTPEAGKYYRATVVATEDACQVVLESSGSSLMTSARQESFKKMVFSNGMDENSSFCSPG